MVDIVHTVLLAVIACGAVDFMLWHKQQCDAKRERDHRRLMREIDEL